VTEIEEYINGVKDTNPAISQDVVFVLDLTVLATEVEAWVATVVPLLKAELVVRELVELL
jgi:hypothetical protein